MMTRMRVMRKKRRRERGLFAPWAPDAILKGISDEFEPEDEEEDEDVDDETGGGDEEGTDKDSKSEGDEVDEECDEGERSKMVKKEEEKDDDDDDDDDDTSKESSKKEESTTADKKQQIKMEKDVEASTSDKIVDTAPASSSSAATPTVKTEPVENEVVDTAPASSSSAATPTVKAEPVENEESHQQNVSEEKATDTSCMKAEENRESTANPPYPNPIAAAAAAVPFVPPHWYVIAYEFFSDFLFDGPSIVLENTGKSEEARQQNVSEEKATNTSCMKAEENRESAANPPYPNPIAAAAAVPMPSTSSDPYPLNPSIVMEQMARLASSSVPIRPIAVTAYQIRQPAAFIGAPASIPQPVVCVPPHGWPPYHTQPSTFPAKFVFFFLLIFGVL
ncbi:unnamed protein product [Gongylonema pulchrum]|uniref:PAM2 domain-containing protein n=1 Tax=Gongylonema pulchrum TaxID=637853 RepID=A0A183E920_9BILA|nr:unnamed protein product [Gongylonema pulchrum]